LKAGNNDNSVFPSEVGEQIEIGKQLVTLAKRTKLNNQLETTMKQCVVTRWNSVLIMIKSFCDNTDDVRALTASVESVDV